MINVEYKYIAGADVIYHALRDVENFYLFQGNPVTVKSEGDHIGARSTIHLSEKKDVSIEIKKTKDWENRSVHYEGKWGGAKFILAHEIKPRSYEEVILHVTFEVVSKNPLSRILLFFRNKAIEEYIRSSCAYLAGRKNANPKGGEGAIYQAE